MRWNRLNLQRAMSFFLHREVRRVNKKLRGDKVEVRYDPFAAELESVLIYSLEGEFLDTGWRHQREGQEGDTDVTPSPQPKVQYNYLELLIEKHQQAIDQQGSGINYEAVMANADRRWPFSEFAKQLAEHLGRRGDLSAFPTDELESLQKVYERLKFLNRSLLETACAQAQQRSIVERRPRPIWGTVSPAIATSTRLTS